MEAALKIFLADAKVKRIIKLMMVILEKR